MKKITKLILGISTGVTILFSASSFIISDPHPDFRVPSFRLDEQIALSEITAKNSELGAFKASVKFKRKNADSPAKEFYGQKIIIDDNQQVDKILIGITNNLISRIEIWNQDNLVETRELGFMDKMTWGDTQTMVIDFYDHTNKKYKGKSKISMRFYGGTGFWGDIGTINFDLTEYGDFSGDKSIGVFAKSINSNAISPPEFYDLEVWKHYRSFD